MNVEQLTYALLASIAFVIPISVMVTEYITSLTGWTGNAARLLSSGVGVLYMGLGMWTYLDPSEPLRIAVGAFYALSTAFCAPSGGYDLIMKFAKRVGNGKETSVAS